ncbi:molybdopterin oxidoreductase family protein [Deinococcus oregonensis]|uniref:Molybdopterin oxidoreductase family protein n=1 Tax=Deinococcus oregonensis TaxID=1805970 RepID=A0ABV6B2C0_9DEIO
MTSETRNSIDDIWGKRTPHAPGQQWPVRVDERVSQTPERWVRGACVLCSNGCGLDIGVKNGKIVGVRGLASDLTNRGRLGPKGLHGWEANESRDRLTRPLIRKEGRLQEASWDEAMGLIVQRSREIVERHTSGAIGFYTSGQLFLEEYYTLGVIGKAGLGTPHMDGNTRLCTATAAAALKESFGSDGQPGSYEDLDITDCILHVGHNIASQHTVLWARILDRLAGPNPPKIIVIDPRRTFTAEQATVHLAPRVGTNVAVLNGLLHLMIGAGKTDAAFLEAHTVGYSELKKTVEKYTPEYVQELSGVPAADLRAAGELLANTATLVSTVLQGVYQSMQATAAAVQVNNIHLIRGLIGKPGSGILQMNGQPTAQNTRETGADGDLPGFRNWGNPEHIQQLAKLWNVPFNKIPHWSPPTHAMQLWRYCEQGSIKMLWIQATNPAVSLPDLSRVRKILDKEDLFVIVQDAFLTETAARADVVLPAALWGEKTGTMTNVSRTVHISCKAVEPPGEARSDLEIFLDYARRMDFRDQDGQPLIKWNDPESAFEAWKECTRGRPCDYTGLTYQQLLAGSGIPWPVNEQHPDGTLRLYEDGVFPTHADYAETYGQDFETGAPVTAEEYRANDPQGRAMIKPSEHREPHEVPDEAYPLSLTTGRQVYHFHTRTKTGRSKALQDAAPDAFVQLSPEDAARYGIEDSDWVLVESRRGLVIERALIGNIEPGLVFIPWHYGSWDDPSRPRAANELTLTEWDPVSKQPHFKYAAVRISKYSAQEALSSSSLLNRAAKAVQHLISGEQAPAATGSKSGGPQPKTTQRVEG